MTHRISRRAFVASTSAALAGAGAAACLPGVDADWPAAGQAQCDFTAPSVTPGDPAYAGRVVEVHDTGLTSGPNLQPVAVAAAVKTLLLGLTGKADLKGAWAALVPAYAAGQVVGIKVNVLNQKVPTHPVVVKAVVDSLVEGLGVAPGKVVVWDRRLDELTKAGFSSASVGGAEVLGTMDETTTKGNGPGYEYGTVCIGGRSTHLSNILTRRIDHLVNVAVMKRHTLSGVTGVMKNHYGSIDNPGSFHDKLGQGNTVLESWFPRAIPGLNALSEVHRKTCLLLVDATIGVCSGDTDSPADCAPNRLLCGLDPVAVDLRTRQIRDLARGSTGADPERISDGWLQAAEQAGLGARKVTLTTVRV